MIETCYGEIDNAVMAKFSATRLLICDVDGVLSTGLIFMGNNGEELKTFHTHDGYGIRCLLSCDIDVAIITGRRSTIVANRANELGIRFCYQGQSDKNLAYNTLRNTLNLAHEQIAYIGDDLIDLPVMSQTGAAIAVANAHPMLLPHADYVTRQAGGYGAVREVCDLILMSQHKLTQAKGLSL